MDPINKKSRVGGPSLKARDRERARPGSSLSVWFSSPRAVEIRERPARPPGSGEMRVRALWSGISHGTEMLVYRGEAPRDMPLDLTIPTIEGSYGFPIKYGYASVGQVTEAGPDAGSIGEGDLVFAFNPHETDYTLPASLAIKLPRGTDPRCAIFMANLETAITALLDAAPRLGERVAVFGQGVLGLLIAQLARRAGASLVATVDMFPRRRALSLALGADLALDAASGDVAERLRDATAGAGADVIIEASGSPCALDEAIKATATEGRIVVVSWYGVNRVPLTLGEAFHRNRITIKSSQVSSLDSKLAPRWDSRRRRELALSYLTELRLEEMITHTLAFEDAAAAYRLVDERPEEVVQVVLEY
jgi:2-desacetyl-2-hydroxyethyl bacteriochlorophyllide A dehydrogenase